MNSNEQLQADVIAELKWDPTVHADNIEISVTDGVVTISGSVPMFAEKQAAELAVQRVEGVKEVSNHITLKPLVKSSDVKDLIENALKRNAVTDADQVTVTTTGGMVTLAGSVRSWDQRREAYSAAWKAPGVTGVENNLEVTH